MATQIVSQNILYPPVPPSLDEERTINTVSSEETIATINSEYMEIERETFVPGKFNYVDCLHTREMLVNAWQAVNQTEMWSFMKEKIERFMLSNDKRADLIYEKMGELGYHGHSGFSFGWTMRQMQFIARYGEKKFSEQYLKY